MLVATGKTSVPEKNEFAASTNTGKSRRASTTLEASARLPRDEGRGGAGGAGRGMMDGRGSGVASGGLARCQRLWKMVPQSRDSRPVWLRQYEVKHMKRVAEQHEKQIRDRSQVSFLDVRAKHL